MKIDKFPADWNVYVRAFIASYTRSIAHPTHLVANYIVGVSGKINFHPRCARVLRRRYGTKQYDRHRTLLLVTNACRRVTM